MRAPLRGGGPEESRRAADLAVARAEAADCEQELRRTARLVAAADQKQLHKALSGQWFACEKQGALTSVAKRVPVLGGAFDHNPRS